MMNDPIANVLSALKMYEKVGKRDLLVHPVSNLLKRMLEIMNAEGYVGELEIVSSGRGRVGKLNLLGNINNCGVIKPRFSVALDEYTKFEKRYLPAKGVGILIVSTPQGVMAHTEAVKKGIGGRLIAYCY
ncbi:30S ribosomal protein S8 [Candidatus Woesearchaeota archaeon]|nr:30S ribosomal protein S8 [Candidatus Woesearchaeota archaeon]